MTADPASTRERLRERARALARRPDAGRTEEAVLEVAVMDLGESRVGIPAKDLSEILRMPPVTPLPGLPAIHRGLAQVRGELVSVVSLGQLLAAGGRADDGVLALVESGPRLLGLSAPRFVGLRTILQSERAESWSSSGEAGRLIAFVTRDLLPVLDVAACFAAPGVDLSGRFGHAPVQRPGPDDQPSGRPSGPDTESNS